MMTATDRLRRMLDELGVDWDELVGHSVVVGTAWHDRDGCPCTALEHADDVPDGILSVQANLTPEQAIAATLGSKKAKAHPYGYEPDTGAFDVTRCECGCLNDISATYCNDCGVVWQPKGQ